MKWLGTTLPILCFMTFILFLAGTLSQPEDTTPDIDTSEWKINFKLPSLYDPQTTITENIFTESSLTFLNVFGSWCPACKAEHAQIIELRKQLDIPIIGINWRDKSTSAKQWLKRYGNPYHTVLYDPEGDMIIQLGITGAPESVIINRNGEIVWRKAGMIQPEDIPLLHNVIAEN